MYGGLTMTQWRVLIWFTVADVVFFTVAVEYHLAGNQGHKNIKLHRFPYLVQSISFSFQTDNVF